MGSLNATLIFVDPAKQPPLNELESMDVIGYRFPCHLTAASRMIVEK
ncbi:hypothetical protein ACFFK0_04785 [Paenibacillus chartarius]|uniref:Uncharacterized protein n=1 Tax=Paenibacillus chartarius TaxID=747481 RepID=A0ABV6DGK9_9BACL